MSDEAESFGRGLGMGIMKGIGLLILGGTLLTANHFDSHTQVAKAQNEVESGTNWLGLNLEQKTELLSGEQTQINDLSNEVWELKQTTPIK